MVGSKKILSNQNILLLCLQLLHEVLQKLLYGDKTITLTVLVWFNKRNSVRNLHWQLLLHKVDFGNLLWF